MTLITFKLISAIIIFLVALLAGLLPIRFTRLPARFFMLGDIFACGIFLGAALFHMLPEAMHDFDFVPNRYSYLAAITLLCFGFLVFLILEKIVGKINKTSAGKSPLMAYPVTAAYLLTLVLAIHSIIEGGALGINDTFENTLLIFIAIVAHKGSASFALAMMLYNAALNKRTMTAIILFFSLMSPVGILIASLISGSSEIKHVQLLTASFNAFAAGTFIYIGMFILKQHLHHKHSFQYAEIVSLIAGIILMAAISIII